MLVFNYFLKVLLAAQFNSMCPAGEEGQYQPNPLSMHKEAGEMLGFSEWGQGRDGNIPDIGRRGFNHCCSRLELTSGILGQRLSEF